jgi:hypothetical protein
MPFRFRDPVRRPNADRRGGTLEVEIAENATVGEAKEAIVGAINGRTVNNQNTNYGSNQLTIEYNGDVLQDDTDRINTLNPPWNPNDPDFINRPTVRLIIEGQGGGERYRLKSKKSKMVSYYKKGGACCGRKPNKKNKNKKKTQNKIGVKTETETETETETNRMLNPRFESYTSPESDSGSSNLEFDDFLDMIDNNGERSDGGHPFPKDVTNKKRLEEEMRKIIGNLNKNKRKSKKKRKKTVKRKKRKSKKTKRRKK